MAAPQQLRKIPTEALNVVAVGHVWRAIQRLLSGFSDHSYRDSTGFDLITPSGDRLPPKAVFGLALSEALGRSVHPKEFSGGRDTVCFRILRKHGCVIVQKGEVASPCIIPPLPEEIEWVEGQVRLINHLKRERAPGLSKTKKADFKAKNGGDIFCERCGLRPCEVYGDEGDACIEVHHHRIQIKDMGERNVTKLDDLKCLCANCHRIVHHIMRRSILRGLC